MFLFLFASLIIIVVQGCHPQCHPPDNVEQSFQAICTPQCAAPNCQLQCDGQQSCPNRIPVCRAVCPPQQQDVCETDQCPQCEVHCDPIAEGECPGCQVLCEMVTCGWACQPPPSSLELTCEQPACTITLPIPPIVFSSSASFLTINVSLLLFLTIVF